MSTETDITHVHCVKSTVVCGDRVYICIVIVYSEAKQVERYKYLDSYMYPECFIAIK